MAIAFVVHEVYAMHPFAFFLLLLGFAAAMYVIAAVAALWRLRGQRVVVCPMTSRPAAVTAKPLEIVRTAIGGQGDIAIRGCSRWPEHALCNQACSVQVAIAPFETRAFAVAERWYAGKGCALCLRAIAPLRSVGAQPGLLDRSRKEPPSTVAWTDVPAETLPSLFATHLPVCASCHRREQFGEPAAARKGLRVAV